MSDAEFVCEGCGIPVVWIGHDAPPLHGFCAVCAWLNEHESPCRIMELRRRMEPGGWIPEPTHRERRS